MVTFHRKQCANFEDSFKKNSKIKVVEKNSQVEVNNDWKIENIFMFFMLNYEMKFCIIKIIHYKASIITSVVCFTFRTLKQN